MHELRSMAPCTCDAECAFMPRCSSAWPRAQALSPCLGAAIARSHRLEFIRQDCCCFSCGCFYTLPCVNEFAADMLDIEVA
jgi:hypothetical protein